MTYALFYEGRSVRASISWEEVDCLSSYGNLVLPSQGRKRCDFIERPKLSDVSSSAITCKYGVAASDEIDGSRVQCVTRLGREVLLETVSAAW